MYLQTLSSYAMAHNLEFDIDYDNKQITVNRRYHASQRKVYEAWTTTAWLDRWWAPKPYQVETKHMDFRVGGYWLYAMVRPEGEKHWCRADYEAIKAPQSFSYGDAFCDENDNPTDFPQSHWDVRFYEVDGVTTVTIKLTSESSAALRQHIEMGFKEGFTAGLQNLEDLL